MEHFSNSLLRGLDTKLYGMEQTFLVDHSRLQLLDVGIENLHKEYCN